MKVAILWLHIANIVAGCAIGSGYAWPWMGFIVAASTGVGAYLQTQLLNNTPTK